MAMATFKCEFPRRQAMLSIREPHYKDGVFEFEEVTRVPVLVWSVPTIRRLFVVELQDGSVQMVPPEALTFLDGKELFDQYDWSEA